MEQCGKSIKNLFMRGIFFMVACVELIFYAMEFRHKINVVNIFVALIYQPFLVMLAYCFVCYCVGIKNWVIVGLSVGIENLMFFCVIIMFVLFLNSLVELVFRMIHKEVYFIKIFALQNDVHNFVMVVISIAAIYAALDSYNAVLINRGLLCFGLLFFVCMIINWLYNKIYLSEEVVSRVYLRFQKNVLPYK